MGKKSASVRKRKAGRQLAEEAGDVLAQELTEAQRPERPARELEDDDLFLLDNQPDDAQAHVLAVPVRRKRAAKGKRPTRAQAILDAGTQAKPLGTGGAYAAKKRRAVPPSATGVSAKARRIASGIETAPPPIADAWAPLERPADYLPEVGKLATRPTFLAKPNRPHIAAVEVDQAGCSYNPDHEQHQDAVAAAVATEMQKQLDKAVEPQAPPLRVAQRGVDLSEMAAGLWSDDDEPPAASAQADDDNAEDTAADRARAKTKRDRAREARRKAQEVAAAEKAALKAQRRNIDNAKQLQVEADAEEAGRELRRQRRKADIEDKESRLPPRLGRHRFQPAPPQVLTSDNVTGSLRKLRTVPRVAKDRFQSLQKRGVIQVTVQQHWTKPTTRRVKQFEKKLTQEKHQMSQEEIGRLVQQNKRKRAAA